MTWRSFTPDRLLAVARSTGPPPSACPPTIYRFMLREDLSQYDLSSIRHFSTKPGSPWPRDQREQWFRATGETYLRGHGADRVLVMMGNFQWFEPRPGSMGKPLASCTTSP